MAKEKSEKEVKGGKGAAKDAKPAGKPPALDAKPAKEAKKPKQDLKPKESSLFPVDTYGDVDPSRSKPKPPDGFMLVHF